MKTIVTTIPDLYAQLLALAQMPAADKIRVLTDAEESGFLTVNREAALGIAALLVSQVEEYATLGEPGDAVMGVVLARICVECATHPLAPEAAERPARELLATAREWCLSQREAFMEGLKDSAYNTDETTDNQQENDR